MRVVGMAPFRIAPPHSGGTRLVYDGARQWLRDSDFFQCLALTTLQDRGRPPTTPFPYREIQAATSLWLAFDRCGLFPKIPYFYSMRWYAGRLVRVAMRFQPDVVEVHMPWLVPVRRCLPSSVRVVLVMQNVESIWYEPYLRNRLGTDRFRRLLARLEGEAVAAADHVICLTAGDKRELIRRYRCDPERVSVIPPGYHPPASGAPVSPEAARRVLFVSSGFHDGLASAQRLIDTVVPRLDPGMELVLAGAVCRKLKRRHLPPSVRPAGTVPDLDGLMRQCRVLVNPDRSRTGINMKVLGALAAGLPVISTPEGARGYEDLVGGPIRVGDLEDFPALIRSAASLSAADQERVRRYDWSAVGARRLALYRRLLNGPPGAGVRCAAMPEDPGRALSNRP